MIVTTLGVQSGTPTADSGVSATAVRFSKRKGWFLVDCGDGTLGRIMRSDYTLPGLDAICITHCHGDHMFGLPAVVNAMAHSRRRPLKIIGPPEAFIYLTTALSISDTQLPFAIDFDPLCDVSTVKMDDVTISPVRLSHRIESHGYKLTHDKSVISVDRDRLEAEGIAPSPLYGELQRGNDATAPDGRVLKSEEYCSNYLYRESVIVCGDNDTPELLTDVCEDVQLLVHEATFLHGDREALAMPSGHSTARMVAEFAHRVGLPRLMLTHFSPRYNPGVIEAEARAHYGGDLIMAHDMRSVEIKTAVLVKGEAT